MNYNRLFRNISNKKIGGVASGLADYLSVDVSIVRVLLVLSLFVPLNVPVVVLYIILWMVMPAGAPKAERWEQSGLRY